MIIGALCLGLVACWYVGDKLAKRMGYDGLGEAIDVNGGNLLSSEPPEVYIEIDISDKDMEFLMEQRNTALDYGMMMHAGEYVSGELTLDNDVYQIEMRLKGHMTDHLEGEKWSFRVKTNGGERVLGMERFSLQHPGTRGYISEYIYHKLMAHEGVIALDYQFVNLVLNGENLGIYALEEHFGQHLLERNERPAGPILRFDPGAYWDFREDRMNGVKILDEPAKMLSATIGTYGESTIYEDPVMLELWQRGMYLLEGFRRGELSTAEAFDIDKLARFHAIIDLVGGWRSLDWSDIKYYYNPATDLLEPIAYESFSGFDITSLVGQFRFDGIRGYRPDFHRNMFNDEDFYAAYIGHVERIGMPAFWEGFWSEFGEDIEYNMAVLHGEFTYKEFDLNVYQRNQESMLALVSATNGLQPYLSAQSVDSIQLTIANMDAFPYYLDEIRLGDVVLATCDKLIIPSKGLNQPLQYERFGFSTQFDLTSSDHDWEELKLVYHMIGSDKEVSSPIFPHDIERGWYDATVDLTTHPQFHADPQLSLIVLNEDTVDITTSGTISMAYDVQVASGVVIRIPEGVTVTCHGGWKAEASEDDPIMIIGGGTLNLISPHTRSSFCNIEVDGVTISGYGTSVTFTDSYFANSNDAMSFTDSDVKVERCVFTSIDGDAIRSRFGEVAVKDSRFNEVGCAGSVMLGSLQMNDVRINAAKRGIEAGVNGSVQGANVSIIDATKGVIADIGADVDINTLNLENVELGLECKASVLGYPDAKMKVTGYEGKEIVVDYNLGDGASMKVNGSELSPDQTMIDRN